jgi:hypothetical protein
MYFTRRETLAYWLILTFVGYIGCFPESLDVDTERVEDKLGEILKKTRGLNSRVNSLASPLGRPSPTGRSGHPATAEPHPTENFLGEIVKLFGALLLIAALSMAACSGKKQEKSQTTQGSGSAATAEKASGAGAQGAPVNQEMTARPAERNPNPPGFASGGGTQAPRQGAPPPEPTNSQQPAANNKGNVSYGNPAGSKPQATKPSQ